MKKSILAIAVATFTLIGTHNMANAQAGGYTGPSVNTATVAQALKMSNDTPVVLQGKIIKSLGGDKYTFADDTGEITIEIDSEKWHGQSVGENDTVEIKGEVDKDLLSLKVDVDSITKQGNDKK